MQATRTIGKIKGLLQELKQALENLYGDRFVSLILYGSHARQEATDDSDIDIMVVLQGTVSPANEIFRMGAIKTALNLKYDELISVLSISATDFRDRIIPFLKNVRQDGIVL